MALLIGTTYAWYDRLWENRSGGINVNSESPLVSVEGYTLLYSPDADGSSLLSSNLITLKSYDSVFGKNENTPAYIVVPVTGTAVSEPGYTLHFSFDCGNTEILNNEGKIKALYSNVAQLRFYTFPDKASAEAVLNSDDPYMAAYEIFPHDGDDETGFVKATWADYTVGRDTHTIEGTPSKEQQVIISVPGEATDGTGIKYVVFELTYNGNLVENFLNNHIANLSDRLSNTSTIEFEPDMDLILVTANN
ncbi:MAG: hypothetical protein Q4B67_00030 [Eubacteriales bacterium]|nr:hypothetical protein [Eubacteriales bacterium]